MTNLTHERQLRSRSQLKTLYAPIATELQQVEDLLRQEMTNPHEDVDAMTQYGCFLGGKRMRPALLLLVAQAIGRVQHDHLVLGAVIEMIHTATLVHDDVLDGADTRRHAATVNARWDAKSAILLGDYLFTHAFYLASTLDSTYACRTIGHATNVVCEGEIRQNASCSHWELTEEEYVSIIDAKTAELCACSTLLGAHYAGADEQLTQHWSEYGRSLGLAFQIVDDILDLDGLESTVGKSLGTDMAQCKPTLPLIHLLAEADDGERVQIKHLLSEPETSGGQLKAWLERFGSLAYARRAAQELADRATGIAAQLQPGAARDILVALPHFVVQRQS